MNPNKICFISCVNNYSLYNEALYYISQLEVPEGYEVETVAIENAESITSGYNAGMEASDAKYKVYIHQDVYIINKLFIRDILGIFEDDPGIGMLGLVGAKTIPMNGIWWESDHRYGKVYDNCGGEMELLSFAKIESKYEKVKALDGLIMVTREDFPWRDDLFDGWHFYDGSQSVEFIRQGYQIAVPAQEEPWVIHDCGLIDMGSPYEHYRKIFLDEYSKDIFPLVSVLIPTYNRPRYFQLALESVLQQTYKNIEIIIGDDSTDKKTRKLVKDRYMYKYPNIKYYHNKINLGQFDNDLKLIDMAKGEFINFLMDDDLFELNKIEKMMDYFIQDIGEEISLVTSHRQMIDDNGNKKKIFAETDKIFTQDIELDGISLGESMLSNNINFIGEPTTVLFRKNKLSEPFGVFNGRRYGCNVDQASWLNLLSQHKGVYINEVLSYFRVHQGQQQHDIRIKIRGFTDYIHEILTCREKSFFLDDGKYIEAIKKCLTRCEKGFIRSFEHRYLNIPEYEELKEYYKELKEKYEEINQNIMGNKFSTRSGDEKQKIIDKFEYDYDNDLFIRKNYSPIKYADGSEKYIGDVFEKVRNVDNDRTNRNLIQYIKDWPSQYHLSKVRTNIFEAIGELIKNKKHVLELGGGMGAVTHWLGENCKYVDVIEGSLQRATVNRVRNKFNPNIEIFVDDLLTMEFPKDNYDLATLIGVLEYIPYYSTEKKHDQACISFLKRVGENLEEDGLLVIAIENKLGAKYFTGCVEDHNGQLFSGIHGYPDKSPITFSRIEMKNILETAGFNNMQFYHCFPDYKMTKVVLQENEDMYELDVASIARGIVVDYASQREYLMADPLLIDSLTRAKLLHEFSNSFLIVCSKSPDLNLKTKQLAIKFSNDDNVMECYHHKINFMKEDGGIHIARKRLEYEGRKVEKDNLYFNLRDEIMTKGETLSLEAYRSLFRKDEYLSLIELTREVKTFIRDEFSVDKTDNSNYRMLKGQAIDCCFNNLIRDVNGDLIFIDRKWKYKTNIPEDYVIFRSLLGLFSEMHPYIWENSLSEFILKVMESIYPKYNIRRFETNLKSETNFRKEILYHPIEFTDFTVGLSNKSYQYKQLALQKLMQKADND